MILRLLFVCLGALLASAAVAAEILTLERALELAERNHPQLRVAAAQIEGAQAGVATARAYPNPEAGVLAGQQRARLIGTVPGAIQVYSFSQPLETRSVRDSRIRAAQLGRESSEYALAEVRIAVRAAARHAFYQVMRRRAELELAGENQRLVEDLRRRIQVQVEVGEAARLELTRVDAEVAIARTSAQSARLRLVTAFAALRAALNLPMGEEIDPRGELEAAASLPSLEKLRSEVLAQYPAIRQAEAEIRRAEARMKSEMALRTPQPTLRSEYEHQPEVGTYRVGLSLPVPLWNKRHGPIAEAAAAVKQARSTLELRRLEINAILESAFGRYQVANQQLAVYQEGVLKQAETALQAAEAAYKFGERGIIEVLDSQRVLRAARLDFLNAQYDRQAALIELEQLRAADMRGGRP